MDAAETVATAPPVEPAAPLAEWAAVEAIRTHSIPAGAVIGWCKYGPVSVSLAL